jgi:nicotinate dehydrogenase subunit B
MSFEPERYELREGPLHLFEGTRRDFLKGLGGIVVLLTAGAGGAQESGGGSRRGGESASGDVSAWIHVGEDGRVAVYTGKVEIGQDIRTSLTQLVAEELNLGLEPIALVMADTDRTPFDAGTFGSRTTPQMGTQLRRAAAATRELLLHLAAESWDADPALLRMEAGSVRHPDGRAPLPIGTLAKGRTLTATIREDLPLRPADRWQIAGRPIPKIDGRDVVTGRRTYTSDLARDGLLAGQVLRPPSFGAKLASLDSRAAETQAGVHVVRDGDFVGVAAPTRAAAEDAVRRLRAEWTETAQPSGAELYDLLRKGAPARAPYETGSVEDALATAARTFRATYTAAYIAHVPLEPRAAVAEWKDGALTVWTGTQRPFGVRRELADAFHLDESKVRVIVPDTGSGYGGKHTGDAALEAARLARAAGRPVKVLWTRTEEMTWAYFRPAAVIDVASGAHPDGTLTAWEHHNFNSGTAGIRTPYEVPHQRIAFHESSSPLRQGSYRGLAATANHFARESHMDEIAHGLGLDALAFRLANLKDERLRAVAAAAAEAFSWDKARSSAERGHGLALGTEKGGYVATFAEVAVDAKTGGVGITRVVVAFECGAIVNPDGLRHQVEGAVIMGLGGALFEQVELDRGRIGNARLAHYRVPRFRDLPALQTVLVDRKDLPSAGAGEAPIIGIAPAIANALFAAAGKRRRALPMLPSGRLDHDA